MTEMAIDPAICLSGWRMRIDNSQEPGDTGRLHVDYAQVIQNYKFLKIGSARFFVASSFFSFLKQVQRNAYASVFLF
jgi:hypothetical protein